MKGESVIETHVRPDSSIVCRPWGNLDWDGALTLRHVVHDCIRPGVEIVFDLSRLDYVDALGMSALVGSVRRVRSVGGTCHIANVPKGIQLRLQLAGVIRLLPPATTPKDNDAA